MRNCGRKLIRLFDKKSPNLVESKEENQIVD